MDILNEFKKIQDNFFENIGRTFSSEFKQPMSEISQSSKEVVINIKLPGINKKNIGLEVRRNYVIVKAEAKKKKVKRGKKKYSEIKSFKGFYRKIALPGGLDIDNAKADFKGNILIINIPKLKIKKIKVR